MQLEPRDQHDDDGDRDDGRGDQAGVVAGPGRRRGRCSCVSRKAVRAAVGDRLRACRRSRADAPARPARGVSSVANWLSSSDDGMKWPVRVSGATRSARASRAGRRTRRPRRFDHVAVRALERGARDDAAGGLEVASTQSAMASSHGARSASVSGWPAAILSTLACGCSVSASGTRRPARSRALADGGLAAARDAHQDEDGHPHLPLRCAQESQTQKYYLFKMKYYLIESDG